MNNEISTFIESATEADLQQELKRYISLFQINEVLSSTLEYDEVLRLVLQEMRALSGAEIASIFLINKTDQRRSNLPPPPTRKPTGEEHPCAAR